MAVFVLVHGAWHGGWCWKPVAKALTRLGHDVHCPTLTGLGERSHLLSAEITSDTHVADISGVLNWRELSDVILLGHSYGGVVISGVASVIPERIRALVYLDAAVPHQSGVSVFARANPERMAAFQKQMDAGAIGLEPDAAAQSWAEDAATRAWILSKCTPHPARCLTEGATLSDRQYEVRNRHYVIASKNTPSLFWKFYEQARDTAGWTTDEIPTWHDAMIEAPDLLASKLHNYANSLVKA